MSSLRHGLTADYRPAAASAAKKNGRHKRHVSGRRREQSHKRPKSTELVSGTTEYRLPLSSIGYAIHLGSRFSSHLLLYRDNGIRIPSHRAETVRRDLQTVPP